MTQRLLIVNADDFGLTSGISSGILRAGAEGIVTSVSVLANGPAFSAHIGSLRDSGLGIGAHLCLVGEDPPLLTSTEVPSLVDRRGRFPQSWRRFLARSAAGQIDSDDVARELSAQLSAIRSAGIQPSHLDTHQHLHLWPQVRRVVLDLAEHAGVGAIRVPRSARRSPTGAAIGKLAADLEVAARSRGLATPRDASELLDSGAVDDRLIWASVERVARDRQSSLELIVHPGEVVDPDRGRYRWGYHWSTELDALCESGLAARVAARGVTLGTFSDLPAHS